MVAQRFVGTRSGVEWTDLSDTGGSDTVPPSVSMFETWVRDFLVHPHSDLGRDGPVCPFVKPAVAHGTLRCVFVPGDNELTTERMCAVVDDAFDLFVAHTRPPVPGAPQMALVTVFPDLTDYARVDTVHSARKDRCVTAGVMVGQFYPGCSQPGLWNKDFRPLNAPLPMLVIRNMMPSDFPFLVGKSEWLFAYLSWFGRALPANLRRSIAEYLHSTVADTADAITDHRVHSAEDFTDPQPAECAGGIGILARPRQSEVD
ncbi:DUF6875 domain-containing protein [Nocardia brevicatena]|uniref:DUF6875 domain-containing protein n=1 Tax=Nocardia brevicatena TaxID=37327 RepID=UPI00030B5823|nr:hypothetical protein [Nocardia brevicatena]